RRGDRTLSIHLGVNGTFVFAAFLFASAAMLMYVYWRRQDTIENFWLFLAFILPVLTVFLNWILKLKRDQSAANFKNMSKTTLVSGAAMLCYFLLLLFV